MPDNETQPRAPRPPPPRSIKALVIPALAMLGAMTWYVAIRVAENELVTQKEARSIQLASKLLSKRRELDSQRLEKECAILAYDTRLGTMLKSDPEPMLIEQFSRSIAKLLPGQDVAILSPDGALIAASRRGIDATTIRSSSVVDRAKAVKPPEDIANLSRSGLWVMRGEERRVLEVAVSSIHLGEPIGMIALTTSLGEVLRDVQQTTGVSGAIFVGNEIFAVEPPEMRDAFASLSDLYPERIARVTSGERELIAQAQELEASGVGIRVVWVDDASPSSGLFGLLLWVPIAGALLLGIREGLAQDKLQKRTR